MSSNKVKCNEFDGTGNVKEFLTKVNIVASIKEYADEKKAQFLASKLLSPAFDVYMRLSDADKKDFDKIKEELLKEFEKGQLNREEAIHLLSDRRRKSDESAQTFAYKLLELVKLSYPEFPEPQRKLLAKDYFLRGVHPEMNTELKKSDNFATLDINALATKATTFEIAGVKSYGSKGTAEVKKRNSPTEVDEVTINSIAEKVVENLTLRGNFSNRPTDNDGTEVQYVSYRGQNNRGGRGRGRNRGRGRGGTGNATVKRCRSCQSTEHIIRNCPLRFCQACGNRGHDQYSDKCPNYEA